MDKINISEGAPTLQEIFGMIADAECEAFELASNNPHSKSLMDCKYYLREALKAYHEATGCTN